ncbi:hypothetical protein DFR67_1205 [Williamsia limnetica]|uniref:Uncharacterized protein n=1 Tax=Williamsia limnetica TaxID=882452 RepID=A0A318RBV8_WILLI|nr:hypothetical protein [Williamsia limnetica]PYE12726.1 hypothetical protein DFR67_1205 [Williamsia limnetica]
MLRPGPDRPVDADLTGPAPLMAFIGIRDLLPPPPRLLQTRARHDGVPIDLKIDDAMFDNWIR